MRKITTFYTVASLVIFTGFYEFLHNYLLYASSDFFHWIFLKMVFILHNVQVLKGECYNVYVQ
jgi:hypothetical protein